MARLQPAKLEFRPGETVGDTVGRILDEEEREVRGSDDALTSLKLTGLAELRRGFGLPGGAVAENPAAPADEMTYELVMDGIDDAPLARLADLVEIWTTIVNGLGTQTGVDTSRLAEYCRVQVGVQQGEAGRELVGWFRARRDMVKMFRGHLEGDA